jgi:hypothetical protein
MAPEKGQEPDVFDMLGLGDEAESPDLSGGGVVDKKQSERRWVEIKTIKDRRINESLFVDVVLSDGKLHEVCVTLERAVSISYMELKDLLPFFENMLDAKRVRQAMATAVIQWRKHHEREARREAKRQARQPVEKSRDQAGRWRSGCPESGAEASGHPLPVEDE